MAETRTYTLGGTLKSGKRIYYAGASLAVEMDHRYLIEPTPKERAEIFEKLPHLKPEGDTADTEEQIAHDDMVRRAIGGKG
jgi:hypothetical protein